MTVTKVKTHEFSDEEAAMLLMIYNNPGAKFTTYGLAQALHPTEQASSDEFGKYYGEVRATSERLIMLDLVDGKRMKDGGGEIYFSDLELTKKGQRKAIEDKSSPDFVLITGITKPNRG